MVEDDGEKAVISGGLGASVGFSLAFYFSPLSLIQIALGPLRVPTFSSFHSFPSTSMVHKPAAASGLCWWRILTGIT